MLKKGRDLAIGYLTNDSVSLAASFSIYAIKGVKCKIYHFL